MKNELLWAVTFLGFVLFTQVAVANNETPAPQQDNQSQANLDPRIVYSIKKLGKDPEVFNDGIVMFTGLKSSFFSKVPVQEVYQFFLNECKKEGDGRSFNIGLDGRWPEFNLLNRDRSKLTDYLIRRGIPSDKADDAAEAILYIGGSSTVGFNKKKLDDAFQEHGKFDQLGYTVKAEPFLCVARQNGYNQNIMFAAGFVADMKSNSLGFAYVPPSYFEAANTSSFNYYGSEDFLSTVGKQAKAYYAKIAQEVLSYAYSGTGIIQFVRIKPDSLFGSISIGFSNHTKTPITFGLQSIVSAKFGDADYGIVYQSIGGKSLSTSSRNCRLVNNDREVLINPGIDCDISISPIEIPGLRPTELPNKTVEVIVLGMPIKLSPVLRGGN
ncbi:MAG: hypothetical protein Q8O31_01715 [Rhodocyclaceae bacterium]|nr:hypothetical protein [Rhodocyclaceae bacterium]